MDNNAKHLIYEEAWKSFDVSVLWYRKWNKVISKILWTEYANIRRLAMIKLYLESMDWEDWELKWNVSSAPDHKAFVDAGRSDFVRLMSLWIERKDAKVLIERAYDVYFSPKPLQYAIDFSWNWYGIDYDAAMEYLNLRLKDWEYSPWEVRWYINYNVVIRSMLYLVENLKLTRLIIEFQNFLKSSVDEEWYVREYPLKLFYSHIRSIIIEERRSKTHLCKVVEITRKDVEWSVAAAN